MEERRGLGVEQSGGKVERKKDLGDEFGGTGERIGPGREGEDRIGHDP